MDGQTHSLSFDGVVALDVVRYKKAIIYFDKCHALDAETLCSNVTTMSGRQMNECALSNDILSH